MDKQKKVDYKKTLIRNTQKRISKSKVIVEQPKSSKTLCLENVEKIKTKKPHKPVERRCEVSETNLDLPQLYSSLRISKEIDNIVKPRKTKSCSDVDKKLTGDEKMTRKVNFPYDQPIYKGLISLTCNKVPTQVIPSRSPHPQKDKEPVLSDFLTPRQTPQYFHIPKVNIEMKPVLFSSDKLKLYKTLQMYK